MKVKYLIFVALVLSLVSSCIEDGFTTSSSDVLEFSVDTLAFDTILTEEGTPTAKFLVYNRHKKMLNISSIRVKGESEAKFYLNVDGMKGEEFHNVEVRGQDSIYVFVQAYVGATSSLDPVEFIDNIEFITNGVEQRVALSAWALDVHRINGDTITEDTRFTAQRPYVIFDTLTVAPGATLTIDPGATLMFHDKAALRVEGTLKAIGSQEKFIHFRGDRLGNVLPDVTYDMMAGQWGGVLFMGDSFDNEMQYVYMRGSSNGVIADSCGVENRKLHIFNSILHNSAGIVLTTIHSWVEAEGVEFSDASQAVFLGYGGKLRFSNCTFANYYLFSAISLPILTLGYVSPDEKLESPLMDACFDNCIFYGNTYDINIGSFDNTDVYIRNCLFKANGEDDDHFTSCVWGGDPKFYTVRADYYFDYRLKDESDAIAKGDPALLPEHARFDMLGNDRLAGGALDLGAYRYIPQPKEEK